MTQPRRTGVDVISGPMSDAERAEIERLAATLKNPSAHQIARRLRRNVGTVNWYMIANGLVQRTIKYRENGPYLRNGYTVYPWKREHDDRIQALRIDGHSTPAISKLVTSEFGIPRSAHSVHVRLAMLAAYDEPRSGAA
ncbi:MAG: hypothetical protein ACREB8_01085 [Pseudolabrys sp.]